MRHKRHFHSQKCKFIHTLIPVLVTNGAVSLVHVKKYYDLSPAV